MSYITKSQDILNNWESIKHLRYFPDFDAKSAGDMYDKICNYEYLKFFYDSMTR